MSIPPRLQIQTVFTAKMTLTFSPRVSAMVIEKEGGFNFWKANSI